MDWLNAYLASVVGFKSLAPVMKGCISDEVDDYTDDCTSLIPPWLIVSLSLLKPLLERLLLESLFAINNAFRFKSSFFFRLGSSRSAFIFPEPSSSMGSSFGWIPNYCIILSARFFSLSSFISRCFLWRISSALVLNFSSFVLNASYMSFRMFVSCESILSGFNELAIEY